MKVDYDQLTLLFTKKKVESKRSLDIEKAAPVKVIRVLEGNRSREVGIAMAKLPAARHIKQAIMSMDPSHISRESITVRSGQRLLYLQIIKLKISYFAFIFSKFYF